MHTCARLQNLDCAWELIGFGYQQIRSIQMHAVTGRPRAGDGPHTQIFDWVNRNAVPWSPHTCMLSGRLATAALGEGICDGNCHDQLRNTVTVHIRSRHIGAVSKQELMRFHALSAMPEEMQHPAYYHLALAEVRLDIRSCCPF